METFPILGDFAWNDPNVKVTTGKFSPKKATTTKQKKINRKPSTISVGKPF